MNPRFRLRLFAVIAVGVMGINIAFLNSRYAASQVGEEAVALQAATEAEAEALGDRWIAAVEAGDRDAAVELLALEWAAESAVAGSGVGGLEAQKEALRSGATAMYDVARQVHEAGAQLRSLGAVHGDDGTWLRLGRIYANGGFDQERWQIARLGDAVRVVDQAVLSAPPRLSSRLRRDLVAPDAPLFPRAFPDGAPQRFHAYREAAQVEDHGAAAEALEGLAELTPEDGYVLSAASSARLRAGDLPTARANADRALRVEPELLEAHIQRLLVASVQADESVVAEELGWVAEHGVRPAVFQGEPAWEALRGTEAYASWAANFSGG